MYYKISDFIEDWKYESESTIKVLSNLTDSSLAKNFGENIRTPGRLAWHIVGAISDLAHRMGLTFRKVDQDSPFPSTAKEIVDELEKESNTTLKDVVEELKMRGMQAFKAANLVKSQEAYVKKLISQGKSAKEIAHRL